MAARLELAVHFSAMIDSQDAQDLLFGQHLVDDSVVTDSAGAAASHVALKGFTFEGSHR